ncbi:MAG: hypothetical protein HYX79_07910 [Chloroflexi bacterium]|nr:hypothetical protein [Chloroflexota bacterium]
MMRKSKKFKLVAAAVAITGILAAFFTIPAFAADPPQTNSDGGQYYYCPGHDGVISEAVSTLLKLTPEQILAQLKEGKSLLEIATAQGVSEDALVKAIIADRATFMQQRVKDGVMTQEQVDAMLKYMEQAIREAIKSKGTGTTGSFGGGMMGGYGGMMGGWNGQSNPGTSYNGFGGGMMGGYGGMMGGWNGQSNPGTSFNGFGGGMMGGRGGMMGGGWGW